MDVLQHRFLVYYHGSDSFTLLGYPLSLSRTEHRLLLAVLTAGERSPEQLAAVLGRQLSRGAIAAHVCGINKKAAAISGRRLLEYRGGAYRLFHYM